MERLGISLGALLVQLFNFLIMFVVINAWVVKPILNMLEKRRQGIAQGLEDARVAADARANAEREAQKLIEDAQVKAQEIIREATDRAEAAAREVMATKEAEASKVVESRLAELEMERSGMLSGLRSQVASLAIAAAQRLIGESLMSDERRQHALLDEFFSGVKDGKVVVLEGAELGAGAAEVTSALPLKPEEQETVRKDLLKSVGEGGTISFRVDPAILGGLVVRVGDRVVDGSVSGQLQDLRQRLM